MPFKSEAQRRWMHEHDPEMAARWEQETTGKLPEHVEPKVKRPKHAVKPVRKAGK